MTKLIKFLYFGLIVVILVLGYNALSSLKILPRFPLFSLFGHKEQKIDETPVIVQEIRKIAQIATQNFYDECIYDSGPIFTDIFTPEKRLILIARGEVIAGFDLNRLERTSLSIKDKSVTLVLDSPRILDVIVNPSDYQVFVQEGNFTFDEVTEYKERAKRTIAVNAIRKKILDKSAIQGQKIIEWFFRLLGYEKIDIIIRSQVRLENNNR
jgi:hypothetical protein